MSKGFFALVVISVLCGSWYPGVASAAAWLKKSGEGELILNNVYYTTDEAYAQNGDKTSVPRFVKGEVNPYIEYGFTDLITLGASTSLQSMSQLRSDGVRKTAMGLGDTEIFLRTDVWRSGDVVISVQPLVKVPGLYNKTDVPTLGNGQVDWEMRMLLGYTYTLPMLNDNYHYTNIEAAYRRRMGSPADELRVDGAVGIRPMDEMLLLNQLFGTFSVNSEGSANRILGNSTDYDLIKYQFSIVQDIKENTSMQLGAFKHLAGKNTGGGGGVLFSVWTKF